MADDVDYEQVSEVISSKYRTQTILALADMAQTPSEIAEGLDGESALSNVSRALAELREREMVELLVPEARKKGRLYGLTEKGEKVAVTVQERESA